MTAEVFLDSNILLYACSMATDDVDKRAISANLIKTTDFALSAQVLQEFVSNALRKKILGISERNIDATMEMAALVPVLPVTRELMLNGMVFRRRFQLSHWDSTSIAAALELGCHTLYSDNLNHGQDYGGVRVHNPSL
jgi:predicted nucleic acid-binding protein